MSIKVKNLVIGGVLIAIGILLPIMFHFYKIGGQIFLPMHLPVLIGGFLLPWELACIIGVATPLLSFLFTSMPPIPTVFTMMVELFVYGLTVSILYRKFKLGIYKSLIFSMLAGRAASILSTWLIIGTLLNQPFGFQKVLYGLFVTGLPGIIIQLILIPILVKFLLKPLKQEK